MEQKDIYGQSFKRARLDAAQRLARPELEDRATAAKEVGVSDAFLRKLESGEKRPGFETLQEMARAYNVLPGDLLPSSALRGPELDRIVAPLMTLPPRARGRFMMQMEAFARMIAAELNAAVEEQVEERRDEIRNRNVTGLEGIESPITDTPSPSVGGRVPDFGLGAVETGKTRGHHAHSTRPIPATTRGPIIGAPSPQASSASSHASRARKVR